MLLKLVKGDRVLLTVFCVVCFGTLVRLCVNLHPYSGFNTPPQYGDYEAQRHWMEITLHLPPSAWYINGPKNNLSYWGIDYPPLSAYQSWLCGKFVSFFSPETVALVESHGYESPFSKYLMRWTAMGMEWICELLVYTPAIIIFGMTVHSQMIDRVITICSCLINPALILIDHGHFQYNSISLGLAAASMVAALKKNFILSSVFFCASLNHKQMSLYYAPAIFAHLFGNCLKQKTLTRKIKLFLFLGTAVIISFLLSWLPFLSQPSLALAVLRRIFPTHRGLYEDYVGNFWCVSSLIIKWRRLFSKEILFKTCMTLTAISFFPSFVWEMLNPSGTGLLVCSAITAYSFFLFSFQVHEKSILLPLLPVTMLSTDFLGNAVRSMLASVLSMYPLLKKDGLSAAYWGLALIYVGLSAIASSVLQQIQVTAVKKRTNPVAKGGVLLLVSSIGFLCIHAVSVWCKPPAKYPYLWDALMVTWGFIHFAEMIARLYYKHFRLFIDSTTPRS